MGTENSRYLITKCLNLILGRGKRKDASRAHISAYMYMYTNYTKVGQFIAKKSKSNITQVWYSLVVCIEDKYAENMNLT